MWGHSAFLLLWRMKLRAGVRSQFRKLKRPRNWIFLALGVLVFVPWILSLFLAASDTPISIGISPQAMEALTGVGILMLIVLSVLGAFQVRGLYLAKEEIELAFSAPVERSDLVRYRMLSNVGRSIFGGLLVGAGFCRRMPEPLFGFLTAIVLVLTLPLLSQAMSLLLGSAENRFAKRFSGWPARVLLVLVTILFMIPFMVFLLHPERLEKYLQGGVEGLLLHPTLQAALIPLQPWVRALHAQHWTEFLPWFGLCALLWFAFFELVARIRVDYRELSLATSATFAAKIARMRKGSGGIGAEAVDKQTAGWNVPWLFGRGPFGAIAWFKLSGIVRKAKGTLLFSALILLGLTLFFSFRGTTGDSVLKSLGLSAMILLLGNLYLASGLRFDFRQDTDIMGEIKTWPLPAWKIFTAMILPQVLLVSVMLWIALLLRSFFTGFQPLLPALLLAQPILTYIWVALDNCAHLLAPVRYSPGQEGALQNIGRAMILMLLRFLVLALLLGCISVPAFSAYWVLDAGVLPAWLVILGGSVLTLLIAGAFATILTTLGGKFLQRYDVSRDRG